MKKIVCTCLLMFFFVCSKRIAAQAGIQNLLNEVLNSTHWEKYFCSFPKDQTPVSILLTENNIPLYDSVYCQGKKIEMYVSTDIAWRNMIVLKKIKVKNYTARLNLIYDGRVTAKFKYAKDELGVWREISSMFKQKYACGGKNKKKSFTWNF